MSYLEGKKINKGTLRLNETEKRSLVLAESAEDEAMGDGGSFLRFRKWQGRMSSILISTRLLMVVGCFNSLCLFSSVATMLTILDA